jgi:phosphonate transport system substrate-binding protein
MRPARLFVVFLAAAAVVAVAALQASASHGKAASRNAACPGGQVRFGIEPYEDPAKLTPAYKVLAGAMQKALDCPVKLLIVEDYPAEVLAMRNKKLDVAEFGPLGYVFASQRAHAQAVASFADSKGHLTFYKAQIWVPKNSSLKTIADLKGHSLALSEPGSTSGDAFPRYALHKAGLKESQVKITYAGGHPESLLALVHGKVDAAEINTQQQASATKEGTFKPANFRVIWASRPIPNDPITVRTRGAAQAKARGRRQGRSVSRRRPAGPDGRGDDGDLQAALRPRRHPPPDDQRRLRSSPPSPRHGSDPVPGISRASQAHRPWLSAAYARPSETVRCSTGSTSTSVAERWSQSSAQMVLESRRSCAASWD